MGRLKWDETGERIYETGVKNGVLYPRDSNGTYPLGVVWNGLSTVTESPSGAEASAIYADDMKYLNLISTEEFGATVEAYTYPDEFATCDGSANIGGGVMAGQQSRKVFGMAYKTTVGNDVDAADHGYKLHLIYGALAAPSEKAYAAINDSPDAIKFSWEIKTTPVTMTGFKPTASLTIDSTKVDSAKLATLEGMLFGTDVADARLPLPDEIAALFASAAPSALALSEMAPLDDATAVAVGSNIVFTFNNNILRESIVVASAAGLNIPGTKTWDTTGKILTFKPTTNLAASTVYIVAISGVVDIYNQSLAPDVKNFTTA